MPKPGDYLKYPYCQQQFIKNLIFKCNENPVQGKASLKVSNKTINYEKLFILQENEDQNLNANFNSPKWSCQTTNVAFPTFFHPASIAMSTARSKCL